MAPTRRAGSAKHLTGSLFLLEARAHEEELAGVSRNSLQARNAVAAEHWDAGRLAEAASVFEAVVKDCDRLLGRLDADALIAAGNLAITYLWQHHWQRGFALLEENIIDRVHVFGENHSLTMTARHAQAAAYEFADRVPEALAAFSAVADQRSRVLGPAHPDSLTSRVALALARAGSGDVSAALSGVTSALADAEQSVGSQAVTTVTIRGYLADCYGELGDFGRAIEAMSRAAADCDEAFGADNALAISLHNDLNLLKQRAQSPAKVGPRTAT